MTPLLTPSKLSPAAELTGDFSGMPPRAHTSIRSFIRLCWIFHVCCFSFSVSSSRTGARELFTFEPQHPASDQKRALMGLSWRDPGTARRLMGGERLGGQVDRGPGDLLLVSLTLSLPHLPYLTQSVDSKKHRLPPKFYIWVQPPLYTVNSFIHTCHSYLHPVMLQTLRF